MKVIISESQYKKLVETGSNSAAMDLDIYTQPMQTDTDNGNLDVIDASEEVIDSFTWQFVPTYANDRHKAKQIIEWRRNWDFIKGQNNVKLNFIKA